MLKKLGYIAGQALFVLVVFVTFLLVFEKHLSLPAWLQVAGRMHPLVLHFPIVLLLGAASLQLYLGKSSADSGRYTHLLRILWLSGALLAGVTVLMGLFLSREDGYEGDLLNRHKWSGAAVFYLAAFLCLLQQYAWLKGGILRLLSALTLIALLFSGHFGAVITHGENFITAPLLQETTPETVALEDALIFDNLVQPVLQSKCTGCHNPEKIKGKLALTDSASIMKGGKSGPLFKPGPSGIGLFMERLHLPLEDKKHMPPKGKPQLSPEEEALLVAWIRAGTPFRKKVTGLPPGDSLFLLAQKRLSSAAEPLETYDFEAPDEEKVAALNTDYRTIIALAKGSPALSVNIFNSQAYTPKQLEELEPLRKQIVSLDVSKMPVSDNDLKIIGGFENLRRLNLNFTEVTSKGLAVLSKLPRLETLSLAGTRLKASELSQALPAFKTLKKLNVWQTDVDGKEVRALAERFPSLRFNGTFNTGDTTLLKLNPPQAEADQWVFQDQTKVRLLHPVKGVRLHYTLDGSTPDSLSPVYNAPLSFSKPAVIRVKGYKEGWLPSDAGEFQLFKNTFKPDSVQILNRLNHVHLAEGAHTFFDTRLGSLGANNPAWANYFAGVRTENLVLICRFDKPVRPSSLGIRFMVEQATGINPPERVEIWGGPDAEHLKLLATAKPAQPAPKTPPSLEKLDIKFAPGDVSCLKIVASPYREGDNRKLLLIDEMFLN